MSASTMEPHLHALTVRHGIHIEMVAFEDRTMALRAAALAAAEHGVVVPADWDGSTLSLGPEADLRVTLLPVLVSPDPLSTGFRVVPTTPEPERIESMALRFDHAHGIRMCLITGEGETDDAYERRRNYNRTIARQLFEEGVGQGFFSPVPRTIPH